MARQASVRLTLENSQFLTEIKHSGDAVDKVAAKGNKGFQLFRGGADAAKRSVMGLTGSLKNVLGLAGGLGGAFTVGGAIKGALQLERTYRQIAFGVKDARGQMLQASDVQRIVERSAAAAAQKNGDMAQTFRDLLDATGDLDFVRDSMEAIGTTSLATGESLGDIATVADQLHTKFGVTAAGMQDGLAQVFGAAKRGGPNFAQFADVISNVGAEMLRAGLDGQRGLDIMLGSLVNTDDAAGSLGKQVKGLRALVLSLGDKSQLAKIGNAIGIDPKKLVNEKDALARLRMIFSKGKDGAKALLDTMPLGDERDTAAKLFVEPFQSAMAEAQGAGLKGKAAIDRALITYDAHIRNFGKATMTGAEIVQRAAEERKSPEAQLTLALNRLTSAFDKPEIIKAITDLAQHLPALANVVADVVAFAAQNPITAGAGAAGLAVGGELLGGVASAAGGALLTRILGGKGGGKVLETVGKAGGGLVDDIAGSGIQRYHQFGLGGGITPEMLGEGAITAGELKGAGIKPKFGAGLKGLALGARGLANTGLGAAGIFGAIAAAGIAGGVAINSAYSKEGDVMGELSAANAAGMGAGSLSQKRAALARLQAAQTAAKGADVGGGFMDFIGRTVTGVDSRKSAAMGMADAGDTIKKLQDQIAKIEARGASSPAAATAEAAKPKPVSLDSAAPRAIAEATRTALGGMVLTVRLASTSPGGIPSRDPSGRGPMNAREPRPGGGV